MVASEAEEGERSPQVRFDHWRLRIARPPPPVGRVPSLVDRWWPQFGREERSAVLIRSQRKRWDSCGAIPDAPALRRCLR